MTRRYVVAKDFEGCRGYWHKDSMGTWTANLREAKRFDDADIERGPELKDPAAFWLPLRPKGAPQHRCHWHAEFIRALLDRDEFGRIANAAVAERDEARAEAASLRARVDKLTKDIMASGAEVERLTKERDEYVARALATFKANDARIAELDEENARLLSVMTRAFYDGHVEGRADAANARRAAIEELAKHCDAESARYLRSSRHGANGHVYEYSAAAWESCGCLVRALLTAPTADDGKGAK